mgnify:FL=1
MKDYCIFCGSSLAGKKSFDKCQCGGIPIGPHIFKIDKNHTLEVHQTQRGIMQFLLVVKSTTNKISYDGWVWDSEKGHTSFFPVKHSAFQEIQSTWNYIQRKIRSEALA